MLIYNSTLSLALIKWLFTLLGTNWTQYQYAARQQIAWSLHIILASISHRTSSENYPLPPKKYCQVPAVVKWLAHSQAQNIASPIANHTSIHSNPSSK